MKRILLSMLAIAVLTVGSLGSTPLPAQELKTIATVSVSGYDELLADVDFIGKLGGNDGLSQMLEGMLQMATQGKGLAGLDKTKPIGVIVQTDGTMAFPTYAFIPVTDLREMITLVMGLQGAEVPDEPADGVYELKPDGKESLFVVQKGGWAFVSNQREVLANVPADPSTLLAGLSDKYDLAYRASISNIPDAMKQMAKAQFTMLSQMGMQQNPGEDDETFAVRKATTERMVKQITTLVDELDEILVGVSIDRDAESSFIDFEVTAVDGTKTAKQFAQMAEATTDFAGFDLPGAAMTGNLSSTLNDDDVTDLQQAIAKWRTMALKELEKQELSEEEAKLATDLLNDLLDVADATIAGRKIDAGMVVMAEPSATTVVIGGAVAKGDTLESLLKTVVQMGTSEQPELAQMLKLDAETHQGVRLHTLKMGTPDPEAAKVFGDTIEVAVGIDNTTIYVAAGTNAVSTIKQVIDKSKTEPGKNVPPMRIAVSAAPIAKVIAAAAPDDDPSKGIAGMVAGMLEQAEGQDKVVISVEGISNGAKMRLELEKGLLQLIGQASGMAGGMKGGPGGGMPGGGMPGGGMPGPGGPSDDDPFGDSPF